MSNTFYHDLSKIGDKNELLKLKLWNNITNFLIVNNIYAPIKTKENSYKFYFEEKGFNAYVHFSIKEEKPNLSIGLFLEDKNSLISKFIIKNIENLNTKKYKYYLSNNTNKPYITISHKVFIHFIQDEEFLNILAQDCIYEISRLYKTIIKLKEKIEREKNKPKFI